MEIRCHTPNLNYPVLIEYNLLRKIDLPKRSFIITNDNVRKVYGRYFRQYPQINFPSGERYKNCHTLINLAEKLLTMQADRFGTLVSLGGGVVGDVTGFLASIYMRGLPYIQIPTTLLAMVDASIGGKTGIDLDQGKNMLGTFWQPQAVFIDPKVLDTLPEKEWKMGMAEIIKHAIIDKKLFFWLIKNKEKIINRDPKTIQEMIVRNILIKKSIVEKDEREANYRAILNLGHTVGHALEVLSNYKMLHGYGVSQGLIVVCRLAKIKELPQLISLLQYFGLPTRISKKYKPQAIIKAMKHDKKNQDDKITLIVPQALGKIKICKNYPAAKIRQALKEAY